MQPSEYLRHIADALWGRISAKVPLTLQEMHDLEEALRDYADLAEGLELPPPPPEPRPQLTLILGGLHAAEH